MNTDEKTFLKNYNKDKYEKPSVTVDTIIFTTDEDYNHLNVLLIKRKKHPFKDKWAIPGGFVNIDESLEDAAKRELKEETNVKTEEIEQLYTFGAVNRDPRMRVISVAYVAFIERNTINEVKADDDASEAIWFNILFENNTLYMENTQSQEFITLDDLAFDHKEVLEKAFTWLKIKHENVWLLTQK